MDGNGADPTRPAAGRWDKIPPCTARCLTYRFQAPRPRIGYINGVFEGYDNLARVQTEDAQRGIVVITVPEDGDALFHEALRDIQKVVALRPLDAKGDAR